MQSSKGDLIRRFLIRGMEVSGYFAQVVCMLAGCFVLALGIWVQLKGNVAILFVE